jgi:putative endopeptidase
MARVLQTIVLLLGTACCHGAASVADAGAGAAPTAPPHEIGVNADIKPGDDFYAYANGDWLKTTEIPADRSRWGARNEIDEKTRVQLASLVEEAAARPSGSFQRKVADFYAAYLTDSVIEAKGITSIKPLLNRIDGVHDKAALARLLGSGLRVDVDPLNFGVYECSHLFGLSVERGIHGEKKYFGYLLQGGLSLPDRDYYLNNTPQMEALRAEFLGNIGRALKLAGFDRVEPRAAAVMELETAIARAHGTREESSNEQNADNHWALADFPSKAPGMDWPAFFAAAGLAKQKDLVAWQPGAIKGEAALIASYPLQTWKNYLRFHVIDRYADVLPRAFAMHNGDAAGAPKIAPREERAMVATNRAMPDAVGRMYVEKYFPGELKVKAQAIVANVIGAFAQRIETIDWMSPATKTLAVSKLNAMYFGVGYPEKWADYSRLTINASDPVGNLQHVADWDYQNALVKLDQPTDATEWVTPPQTVSAYSIPLQNAYNFCAALLQAPKFDPTASDAANYGAIGAILGHEVSHFVDLLGAEYDAQGGIHHWWTSEDKAQFEAVSQPLVKQFSSYSPFPDLAINGKLTLSENIADLGGLAAAFDAYRRTLGNRGNDKNYVRQQDRQFFIGFARAWRVKLRDDALRTQVATNDHAPENFRVSTVRNLDAWYDAFDVVPGQRLYLEPTARVRIW